MFLKLIINFVNNVFIPSRVVGNSRGIKTFLAITVIPGVIVVPVSQILGPIYGIFYFTI